MGEDLVAGRAFPDLVLPDHAGNQRHLSQLAADDPVLLHFYRGWWCPKEQAYFRNLVGLQDEADVAYTRFVSVSVNPPSIASSSPSLAWPTTTPPTHHQGATCPIFPQ